MRKEQIETIATMVGTADAFRLINKLITLGVGEDVDLSTNGAISIPQKKDLDLAKLKSEFASLSVIGRSYEISDKADRLSISTTSMHRGPVTYIIPGSERNSTTYSETQEDGTIICRFEYLSCNR